MGIIRNPNSEELKDFIPIAGPSGKTRNAEQKFNDKLAEELEKAMKNGLPFCDKAARNDWKDYFDKTAKDHMRRYGYIKMEEVKMPEIDWGKYSDLNNFEFIEEGEKRDDALTKAHFNRPIIIKFKTYKYKGYERDTYIVMEDPSKAIQRAYANEEAKVFKK